MLDGARVELTLYGAHADDIDVEIAAATMRRLDQPRFVVVRFDSRATALAAFEPVMQALDDYLLLDALCVTQGTWRSLLCTEDECCPPQGRPLDSDLAAEYVALGSAPFASCDDLTAALRPVALSEPEHALRAAATAAASASDDANTRLTDVLVALVSGNLDDWRNRMTVCVGLGDYRVRDGVLRHLYDNPSDRLAVRGSLLGLVGYAPCDVVAAVATTLAGCAWLDGNAALTQIALRHAQDADAAYSLARLLDRALRHAVPPCVWTQSLAAVSMDDCVAGAA